ncbi:single-stranded DNA-binding protein [Sphaerisporangium aureirubrum]|uniref:Single-stranded DNA-binding protein n=1 Tax=Sphaerisporangium aureirubrum TaxID=1544736 RepID=A0ABW1NX93_9ACTN
MHRNEVRLVGRVSKPPRSRQLPNGDQVTTWGLAVRRPPGHPSTKKSDGITCVTFDQQVVALVTTWQVDDTVSIEGALHHRFWTTRHTSTYEVEVHQAQTLNPTQTQPPTLAPTAVPSPAETPPDGSPAGFLAARPAVDSSILNGGRVGAPVGDPPTAGAFHVEFPAVGPTSGAGTAGVAGVAPPGAVGAGASTRRGEGE